MKRAYGIDFPDGLADIASPDRMAIVIYDMQVGIVSQIGDSDKIVDGCGALLTEARARGYRIFYTRHQFLPNHTAGLSQLRRAMIWQKRQDATQTKPAFSRSSAAAQIVPSLAPTEDDVVIDKVTMSAFEGTYLNIALRDLGISAFAIAGIALEVGIEPTVRHALDLNYIPILIADLCGSRSGELHQRSLETLTFTGEVMVTNSQEFTSQLAGER